MLYYNQISQNQDEYILNVNGINQYFISQTAVQGGVDFVEWDRFQPWTFFAELKLNNTVTLLYNTRITNFVGIAIYYVASFIEVVFHSENGIFQTRTEGFVLPNSYFSLQITYDGSSIANGINFYVNNAPQNKTFISNSLAGSIINPSNRKFEIGNDSSTPNRTLKFPLKHLSFINYVKSPTERLEDFNNKKQSKGIGEWLLAPIEPIYKNDNSKQIKTLSTTSINQPLPNPNAFTNEQGYKLNIINYPTTLVKGVNLIKL